MVSESGSGIFLGINEICTFVEGTPNSRNFREGEDLVNSKHIVVCASTKRDEFGFHIFGLVLRGSGVASQPHEVEGILEWQDKTSMIKEMKCSCSAGQSYKCKHVAAILLHCSRNDMSAFEALSQTDLKCSWKNRKGPALEQYNPLPLLDTKCYKEGKKPYNKPKMDNEQINRCLEKLLQACPNSALSLHRAGRNKDEGSEHHDLIGNECETKLAFEMEKIEQLSEIVMEENNPYMNFLNSLDIKPLHDCCQEFYDKQIVCSDPIELCLLTERDKAAWKRERQFRITGSRCYSLYTYGNNGSKVSPDWVKKSVNYFWAKETKHLSSCQYGIAFEEPARQRYKDLYNAQILQTGLIIDKKNPWLGFSPDGIVIENGKMTKLLEIKCPVTGIQVTMEDAVKELSYIKVKDGVYSLKKKHSYYGQVQLGMAMLNVKSTDFILYASKDSTIVKIDVPLDEEFVNNLLEKLKINYFYNMLHNICIHT